MRQPSPVPEAAVGVETTTPPPARASRVVALVGAGLTAVTVLAAIHLTQGTSAVDAADLYRLVTGRGTDQSAAVMVASRIPRLLAGVLVGVALGFAGTALQSLARNPLASPDTLGVDAGAYLAVVVTAAFGVSLPVLPAGGVAFAGGLVTAMVVLGMSASGAAGPTRLVLAGSAVGLALWSMSTFVLLLDPEGTIGLFAWRAGSLGQTGVDGVAQMAPVVLVGVVGCLLIGRTLDLLALGDDTARVMGIGVRRSRMVVVVLAVLLSAAAVAVAGPVGFVGLAAPAIVRVGGARLPEIHRHHVLFPLCGIAGVIVVLAADVLLRAVLGGQGGVEVPTGVVTSIFGAGVLVWLASRYRDSGHVRQPPGTVGGGARSHRRFVTVLVLAGLLLVTAGFGGLLAGDTGVLGGDLVNWLYGRSGRAITFVLDARLPRVVAALLAGAALGIAGTVVQGVCRNPLAEPGLLGITGGAGVGAVLVLAFVPQVGIWTLTAAAAAGALLAFALVYGLSSRVGLTADRLVLIGIGVSSGAAALITLILLVTNPWNLALALTWLSGSTYGRTLPQLVPVLLALLVLTPLALAGHRELDLLTLDDDTPRVLGVPLSPTRFVALVGAALLTATAVSAIGVVGFVGLVAPHAARVLVGSRHLRVIPVAGLLGAGLVSVADTVGRTIIAPGQIPAGLLAAILGAPYFVWLLWRSRRLPG
ncbi:iron ABC transporter permease [Nitriliruptor sp.]|uniref:iron ABC transporter permease n=1 Tax=Nitriliruptor sp. TaxID=2448056 RepID=UPI0034A05C54